MNIAIIGAGATGLAAAHDLLATGHTVTVIEASDKPGGLAAGFKQPNWEWSLEKFYHHWFASDADLLRLARDIGVRDRVVFKRPLTVSYYKGDFYALDGSLSSIFGNAAWLDKLPLQSMIARGLLALKFPGFNLADVLSYGTVGVKLLASSDWKQLEHQTAYDWLSKNASPNVNTLIWQPLLEGKFGDLYQKVNMAWLWARIKSRTSQLGTFVGGFQAFFDALAQAVQSKEGGIRYNTRAEGLEWVEAKKQWRVNLAQSFTITPPIYADKVLVTTSPRLMAKLAPQLPADYLGSLNGLTSLGAVIVIFALDRQLDTKGYYWHNLSKAAGFPYLALCEHTNFVDAKNFGGQHLIYCGDYLPTTHPYFVMSDDALRELYLPTLKRFNANFDPAWIQNAWVFREAYAQPVPFVDHSRHIPSTKTPLPGLHFASMSQVYPWDRGTNYAVKLGREVATGMMNEG